MVRDAHLIAINLLSPLGPITLGSKRWHRDWRELIAIIEPGVREAWKVFGGGD